MDKNVKAMLKINDTLDDRYQKLCDKYHDLELSHNRKKKALLKIKDSLEWEQRKCCEGGMDWCFFNCLIDICDSALFCDGRERSKK